MSITQCPKCDEKVTLPAGGHRDARVRCPLCQEEYVLSEALDKLPPTLILLDAPLTVDEPHGELDLHGEPESGSDELNLEPVASGGDFSFDSAGASSTATLTKPATIRPTARPKLLKPRGSRSG